jgi:hypothetical protein
MRTGFDINKIQGDGYLIIPLSMSRLASGQNPAWCYEVLRMMREKLETFSNDVVFLYTNGLYFNSMDISFENRKRTNQQVINHNAELRNLIEKGKDFIPGAVHYLPIDYIILNTPVFREFFQKLKQREQDDGIFQKMIKKDMGEREYNEANINFLLEEITVAHIIRERLVDLPRTLVKTDAWRLIGYAGKYLYADAYQSQQKILPQIENSNPFAGGQYDFDQKKFFVFSEEEVR